MVLSLDPRRYSHQVQRFLTPKEGLPLNPADELALRAASRLSSHLDADLPALTQRAIYERDRGTTRSLSFGVDPATATAITSILLTAAQFAYQIYRDLKADRENKSVLLMALKDRISTRPEVSQQQLDDILECLVDEVVASDETESAEEPTT